MLPDSTDSERFFFLEGLVSLVNELEFKIYRIGYFNTVATVATFGEKGFLSLCFFATLSVLKDELTSSQVWPVMETDRSSRQDQSFPGMIQSIDYMTERFPEYQFPEYEPVHYANLGEVLYMTKRSAYGALVDCVAYLLHAQWLQSKGHNQTPYKDRLANIASNLGSAVAFDEVIRMNFGSPQAS